MNYPATFGVAFYNGLHADASVAVAEHDIVNPKLTISIPVFPGLSIKLREIELPVSRIASVLRRRPGISDPWFELVGIKGQVQVASELKLLPGGNRLKLNVSPLNNPSHDALDFSYGGQIRLEVHGDRVVIDNHGHFSNFNKYKSELQIIVAVLAFLGLAKIPDLVRLLKHVKQWGKRNS